MKSLSMNIRLWLQAMGLVLALVLLCSVLSLALQP